MGSCISKDENHNRSFVAVAPVSSSSAVSASSSSSSNVPAGKPIIQSAAEDEQQSSMAVADAAPERRKSSPPVRITRLSPSPVGGGGRRKESVEIRLPVVWATEDERESSTSSESEDNGEKIRSFLQVRSVGDVETTTKTTTTRELRSNSAMVGRSSFSRDLAAFSRSLAALSSPSPLGAGHLLSAAPNSHLHSPIAAQFQIYARSSKRIAAEDADDFSSAAANARSRSLPKRFYGNEFEGGDLYGQEDDYNYNYADTAFYRKRRSGAVDSDNKWGELGLSPRCAAASAPSTAIKREEASAGELRVRSRHAASRRSRHLHHDNHSSTRASPSAAAVSSSRNSKLPERSPLRRRRIRRPHHPDAGGGINDNSSRRRPELRIPQEEDADFAQIIVSGAPAKQQNGPNGCRSALKDRPLNCTPNSAMVGTSKKQQCVKTPWKSGKKPDSGVVREDHEWCDGRLSMEEPSVAHRSDLEPAATGRGGVHVPILPQQSSVISDKRTDMADFLQSAALFTSSGCAPTKKKELRAPSVLLKEAAMDAFGLANENKADEDEDEDEEDDAVNNNMEKVMELLAMAESEKTTEFSDDELRMVVGSNPVVNDDDDRSELRRYRQNGLATRVNSWPRRSIMLQTNVSRSTSEGLMQKTSPQSHDRSNKCNVDVDERNLLRLTTSDRPPHFRSSVKEHDADDEFAEEEGEGRIGASAAIFVGSMSSSRSWVWQRDAENGVAGRRRSDGGESEASFEFHQIRSGGSTPSTPIISRASTPRRSC